MDPKVPDEEEKKNPTKKKSSSDCHNPFLMPANPSQNGLLILAVMQIPWMLKNSFLETVFVRKFVCFFCRCFDILQHELDSSSNAFTT